MKELSELVHPDLILVDKDFDGLIQPVDSFPADASNGKFVLLTKFQTPNYQAGKTYKKTDSGWELVNYTETGSLGSFGLVYANSIHNTDTGTATVYIRWTDPEDTDDAIWHHTVLVRRKGRSTEEDPYPQSIDDGEVVGYSSIRNQYKSGSNVFVDTIDGDSVDGSDIIDPTLGASEVDPDEQYYYRLFAVTRYGVVSSINGCFKPTLDWETLRDLVRKGYGPDVAPLGSIFVVHHGYNSTYYPELKPGLDVDLCFEVVDHNKADASPLGKDDDGNWIAYPLNDEGTKFRSLTLMVKDVIFRGSFDDKEHPYALSTDTACLDTKVYYKYDETTEKYTPIAQTERGVSPKNHFYERNPAMIFSDDGESIVTNLGRNSWHQSNSRYWLNNNSEDWWEDFKTKLALKREDPSTDKDNHYSIFEDYKSENPIASYARFPISQGFLYGLPSDFLSVLVPVNVKTHLSKSFEEDTLGVTQDYVFLPSYRELFGDEGEIGRDTRYQEEGYQFDIYSQKKTDTRQRTVLDEYNTTPSTEVEGSGDPRDNLSSFWLRSAKQGTVHQMLMMSNEHRQYDPTFVDLGEDGEKERDSFMPAGDSKESTSRDTRDDSFTVSSKSYLNNTSPGFCPCVVIA